MERERGGGTGHLFETFFRRDAPFNDPRVRLWAVASKLLDVLHSRRHITRFLGGAPTLGSKFVTRFCGSTWPAPCGSKRSQASWRVASRLMVGRGTFVLCMQHDRNGHVPSPKYLAIFVIDSNKRKRRGWPNERHRRREQTATSSLLGVNEQKATKALVPTGSQGQGLLFSEAK